MLLWKEKASPVFRQERHVDYYQLSVTGYFISIILFVAVNEPALRR